VNGTSFCAVTRDDGCVESLCCISCFCRFGFEDEEGKPQ